MGPERVVEGSSGFQQQKEGKSTETAASSVLEPPRGHTILVKKELMCWSSKKLTLGLFGHWPQAAGGVMSMNMVIPQHSQHSGWRTGCLLPHTSFPLIPSSVVVQGTCSRWPLEWQLQPARNPVLSFSHHCRGNVNLFSACTQPNSGPGKWMLCKHWQPADRRAVLWGHAWRTCLRG